nr:MULTISPECIES: hypothetical protein [unclassified Xenorhabdus]
MGGHKVAATPDKVGVLGFVRQLLGAVGPVHMPGKRRHQMHDTHRGNGVQHP